MTRGYLNSLSFPANDVDAAKELLSDLRKGISRLVGAKLMDKRILCNLKSSEVPLTPDYLTLHQVGKAAGAGFRDTFLYFLNALDQQTPAQDALSPQDQEEAFPSEVDADKVEFDPHASTVLVSCALDNGVLLSLGTDDRWRAAQVPVTMLTASADQTRSAVLHNVCNDETSLAVSATLTDTNSSHRFENWEYLTKGATKAKQLDDWFSECLTRPGLEQVVMRAVSLACQAEWFADGELVKKLDSGKKSVIFEVRAYHNGSNNVRLLFGRDSDGAVFFGYGGLKTSPNWYDHATPQARSFFDDSLKEASIGQ